MSEEHVQAAKQTDAWRRLRSFPHWGEIELLLRDGKSPREVVRWHVEKYPGDPCPHWRTLYRFLKEQSPTWFFAQLLGQPLGTIGVAPRQGHQKLVELAETVRRRIQRALEGEGALQDQNLPVLMPELTRNIELLAKIEDQIFRMEQELGLKPRVVPAIGEGVVTPLVGQMNVLVQAQERARALPDDVLWKLLEAKRLMEAHRVPVAAPPEAPG